ncbi:MAG: hypothetical protein JWN93_1071 [Hyphomicrobiales bacterium]|nr:hypothetical protein [Hyphomicrobiales bacterium]
MPTVIFLLFTWLIGAAHVQMYMTGQAFFINSTLTADRWTQVCQYYKPVALVKKRFPAGYSCPMRLKV